MSEAAKREEVQTDGDGDGDVRRREPYDDVRQLPDYGTLKRDVNAIVAASTWWELYGVDWCHVASAALLLWPLGLYLFSIDGATSYVLGALCHGYAYASIAQRAGHISSHDGLCKSRAWSRFWCWLFVEPFGAYSYAKAMETHILIHHPHTNVIGLGDSSSWRAPFLPRYIYLFLAPHLVPLITPWVAVLQLWGQWRQLAKFVVCALAGQCLQLFLYCHVAGFSLPEALVTFYVARAVFAVPYIHINIFQHIGLPMYSVKTRPPRLQLMSTGCLNLTRNPLLDHCFGHSLINCHVEHHLFPRLSDNMCLKVKPVVRAYLLKHGLPYNESGYLDRLWLFVEKYEQLMVAPPAISEFVGFGLQ